MGCALKVDNVYMHIHLCRMQKRESVCVYVKNEALLLILQRCSVLQCVAVCCSVLQCVAVCCSVLQCVALLLILCACACGCI